MGAQEGAARSKLYSEEQCALGVVCNGNISPGYLRHVRGLQFFVFEPGGELYVLRFLIAKEALLLEHKWNGPIILQGSDLRTNPFKGGGDGAALISLISLKLKVWDSMYGRDKLLINAWLNGQYQGLIGMIYEVLDRERMRSLGTALKQLEQGGFNQLSLTGAMEIIPHVQVCMKNKENMAGSFWIGLDLKLGEIRLFRPKRRAATTILIHLLSYWTNITWRIKIPSGDTPRSSSSRGQS